MLRLLILKPGEGISERGSQCCSLLKGCSLNLMDDAISKRHTELQKESLSETGDIRDEVLHSKRFSGSRRLQLSLSQATSGASFRLSNADSFHIEFEKENASEAGDIGDRELHSNRFSGSGRLRLCADNTIEEGSVVPIPEGSLLNSYELRSHDSNECSPKSFVLQSSLGVMNPNDKKPGTEKEAPWLFEYISCLVHLAAFGILGVLTRFLLQKLFGPGGVDATSDESYMYLDLPSNMVGSFLMGWLGVVFKADISRKSDKLAIGLTTGYLGSLTTFSGWNQKMLDLSVRGEWVFAVLGYLIGLSLVAVSIVVGVETAQASKWLLKIFNVLPSGEDHKRSPQKDDNRRFELSVFVVMVLVLCCLWVVSAFLEKRDFQRGGSGAQLWLGCIAGPFGVWIRWFLARLNGQGLGKTGFLRWLPFGTLIANVSASCIMAALATVKKAVNKQVCDTVATGLQFGLMGCLSTVSTFIAEFHAMRQTKDKWRAYVYALITILASFILGTLIYSVPVWIKGL